MKILRFDDNWRNWDENVRRVGLDRCPEECRAFMEARDDGQPAELAVADRVALRFVLWASSIPGWACDDPDMPFAVGVVDVPGTEQLGLCAACGHGEPVDEEHVPTVVRKAIGVLIDAFDEDEIGQVDQDLIDALRPFRA